MTQLINLRLFKQCGIFITNISFFFIRKCIQFWIWISVAVTNKLHIVRLSQCNELVDVLRWRIPNRISSFRFHDSVDPCQRNIYNQSSLTLWSYRISFALPKNSPDPMYFMSVCLKSRQNSLYFPWSHHNLHWLIKKYVHRSPRTIQSKMI